MILVIVESPSKCKKIETYLGPGYKCVASFGHICEFKDGLKSIDKSYNPTFKICKKKMQYVGNIRRLMKKAKEVIIATDDDREGEAIGWHLCKVLKLDLKTTKRIIFHEITKKAIQTAIKNPTIINMKMVEAQQSRQMLDLIVGFKISPLLWANINKAKGLSAGRCQSPALRLIYENQKEIDELKQVFIYNVSGYFTDKKLEFKLNFQYNDEDTMCDFLGDSLDHEHKYSISKPKQTIKKSPLPFTTSSLQQKASNEMRFSPKQTMKLAQTLYENGLITYMRTDSVIYSKEFLKKAEKFITDKYGEKYYHFQEKKSKKMQNAQEAHEAIRPTSIEKVELPINIDEKAVRLYNLIRRNTLESCMADAKLNVIEAKISAPEKHFYKYRTELVVFPGWLIVSGYDKTNPIYDYLLTIENGTILDYIRIYCKCSLKNGKLHYTEAALVKKLEKLGIGRPSTFSSIISKIQDKKYVEKKNIEGKVKKCNDFELISGEEEINEIEVERTFAAEKNKLVITPVGIIVIEFLLRTFESLFNYEYTSEMEKNLDMVSQGTMNYKKICKSCDDEIALLSKDIKKTYGGDNSLHKFDEHHSWMIAKYGPVVKQTINSETKWLKVKKDLTLAQVKKMKLEDVLLPKSQTSSGAKELGEYKGEMVFLREGKYGHYLNHTKKNYSAKGQENITLKEAIEIIEGRKSANPSVLKVLNKDITIRKGKYGPYIFYKSEGMTKPRFLKLKDLEWKTMSNKGILKWINEQYF
tara:strand:- start:81 stop:2339 length:2259 start_codon:yes stop_codon:yes gene_type:complete